MNLQLPLALVALTALGSVCLHAAPDTATAAKQIDAILAKDWEANKIKGNPAADDNTFVRRLYLDVIGRIPTAREAEAFLTSKEPNKRTKLIDKLLASEGYVQHFFNYWADVLRAQSNGNQAGVITGSAYTNFIKQSLRDNVPYNKFVREMVSAQGKAWENGAIGYYMRDRGMPLDNMANTVRVFLGTRIECAQCHNHPFDKWTQMQFYKMAAFTFGVETQDYYGSAMNGVRDMLRDQENAARAAIKEPERPKKTKEMTQEQFAKLQQDYQSKSKEVQLKRREAGEKFRKEQRNYQDTMTDIRNTMRYTSVSMRENRKPSLPHDYKYDDAKPKSQVEPGTMMGHECTALPGETPLEAYARWMASKENPRFTTVITNRLWKKAFGLALIEPLDELMDGTAPMIPAMQKHLEQLMIDVNYDMKAFLRVLFNTSAYQRQVTREEVPPGVVYHFTGPMLRRMSAEQMWDSFVTLINPNPDMINAAARETTEQRILQAKKNADGIDALTPEEMLAGIKKASAVYDRNRSQTETQQKLFAEARAAAKAAEEKAESLKGEERAVAEVAAKELRAKASAVRAEVNKVQGEGRRASFADILIPGQKKLYEKVTGKPFQTVALKPGAGKAASADPAMMAGGGSMMMEMDGIKVEKVIIPGYDRKEVSQEERKAQSEARIASYKEEAEFYGVPEKDMKYYFRARESQSKDWLRAAEVESPAPRGHYLREFGQSDRETIENANNEASVPQALALMNGQLLPQIIGKYSQLMLTISKAQYPADKVEAAYMALLSRKPTAREKDLWLKAQDKGLSTMDDLLFSLLNTQQFIFIQ